MIRSSSLAAGALVAGLATGCVSAPHVKDVGAPRYPSYTMPPVPGSLNVASGVVTRYDAAWRQFQGGDVRGADRILVDLLRGTPGFYPADAALGFVALADGQAARAVTRFTTAATKDERYVPAWLGLAEAQLAVGDEGAAAAALERVLALEPGRDAERTRLELLRFRQVQTLIAAGRTARGAGRLEESERTLTRALALAPTSGLVLRELALTGVASRRFEDAEQYARRALAADPNDADAFAALGQALDGRGLVPDAAAAYARAAAIDSKWRADAEAMASKARRANVPPELGDLADATTVSRAQVAALVGLRLSSVLRRASPRPPEVATDIRGHWAAAWILDVTQAGIMEVLPNHTFQPGAVVSRADLAEVAARLVTVALSSRSAELARLQGAQPRFSDLPAGHLSYRSAAVAVAAGAMTTQPGDRFAATQPASGLDLMAVVNRIELMIR